jgi:hypothetical protein
MASEKQDTWSKVLWRLFVRILTYQFVFFWIYIKYNNFSKHSIILKNKVYEALGTKSALIDEIFTYPEITIRIVTYIEAFLFFMSVIGKMNYAFYLSIITGLTALLYNNPFLKANREQFYLGLSPDFMLGIGVSLAIMISSIRPHCSETESEERIQYDEEDDDDEDEDEKNLSSELNMSSKVSNKEKKHKKK